MDLITLNQSHQSDKGLKHPYLQKYYQPTFAPYQHQAINILEVGIYHGASMNLWMSYFTQAKFWGIDIKDRSKYFAEAKNLSLFVGRSDQQKTYEKIKENFDIIIDDGNHRAKTQIPTFEILFNKLKSGGLYIIEDIVDLTELQAYFDAKDISYTVHNFSDTHEYDSIIIDIQK